MKSEHSLSSSPTRHVHVVSVRLTAAQLRALDEVKAAIEAACGGFPQSRSRLLLTMIEDGIGIYRKKYSIGSTKGKKTA